MSLPWGLHCQGWECSLTAGTFLLHVQVTCIWPTHCRVEGHAKQPWCQSPPNYGCLLCPAWLWESAFWTETVRNSFFRKTVHNLLHSAHKTPRMPCMLGMLSVPSLMESIWDKMFKCPHLFQKWNFIMEIRKFKKKYPEMSFRSA